MNKFDAILFEAAAHVDIQNEKDHVWMEITRKQLVRKKIYRYALSAAALVAVFTGGVLVGAVSERGHILPGASPGMPYLEIPQTDEAPPQGGTTPDDDFLPEYIYLADIAMPIPLRDGGIEAYLPQAAPDGMPAAEADSENSWHCGEGSKWVHAELAAAADLRPELTDGLPEGHMRTAFANGGEALADIWAVVYLGGEAYLSITSDGLSYDEILMLLESIG